MFDINGGEFLLILVVAIVVVGPERLPRYAEQLGGWVRTLRRFLRTAKQRVDTELGDQAGDVDWAALDPRRYDPRRIVREALLDDDSPPATTTTAAPGRAAWPAAAAPGAGGAGTGAAGTGGAAPAAPYDDEAT
ncbi:Sec-independent protein translocase protein TatB [Cellulomonas fimi]|uniref:Twin-arginine translocase subunit TatB n=1 Tax=Cellulomonas fimi TaxID=1708 RepID=A0A7Y0QH76_CELFI|nr:Sec-independent protein translocase protein TatB [Cellulomonas fimi]NMR19893.1 twin-arginine translocase subunit TatB [Cellulomonas fimi]